MVDRITGPVEIINATLSGSNTYFPPGSVTNSNFSSNSADRLDATKASHQKHITWTTATDATEVSAVEKVLHVAQGAGTIVAAYVHNITAPTGGDKDYLVDIVKDAGDGTFSSILSSDIASPADDSVGSGTLATTAYSQYDVFKLDMNTSGSTGTNGSGVTVTLILNEAPS